MNKKISLIVIILLILALALFLLNKYIFSKNSQTPTKTGTAPLFKPVTNKESNPKISGKLLYVVYSDKNEIYLSNLDGSENKIVFTDADRDLKVKKISNVADLAKEVLIFSKTNDEDFNGTLELAKVDSSGQTEKVSDKFPQVESISLSPDAKEIGYVSFSNVEADYGYSLYTMTNKGENLRQLARSELEISSPSWSPNSNNIAYIQNKSDADDINIINLESGKIRTIFSTEQNIYSLSWNSESKLIFGFNPKDNFKKSEIDVISEKGKDRVKITSNDEMILNFGFLSSSNQLGFLKANYDDKINAQKEGEIDILNTYDNSIKKISTGRQVLGWLL